MCAPPPAPFALSQCLTLTGSIFHNGHAGVQGSQPPHLIWYCSSNTKVAISAIWDASALFVLYPKTMNIDDKCMQQLVGNCISYHGFLNFIFTGSNNLFSAWYITLIFPNNIKMFIRALCPFSSCPSDCTGRLCWQPCHTPSTDESAPIWVEPLHHMTYLALKWRHGGVGAQQAGRPSVGEKKTSRRRGSLLSTRMTSSNPVFRSLSLSLSLHNSSETTLILPDSLPSPPLVLFFQLHLFLFDCLSF